MTLQIISDLLTVLALICGLFFMLVAAVGLLRMPDLYNRMHAATKGVTLGVVGMLLAVMIYLPQYHPTQSLAVFTKVILVILFTFIANPVGAHLLAKAAHLDKDPKWQGTLDDELEADSR